MNKLINAVAGDGKNTSPARKYVAYAIIITAIAFILALVILIVSSIAFAVTDGKNDAPVGDNAAGDGDVGGGTLVSSTLQYESITADKLAEKADGLVSFTARAEREIESGTNKLYYAQNNVSKLSEGTMKALDSFMKDFYTNNKSNINPDIGADSSNPECDIPLIVEANEDGTSFKIVVFGNDETTFNDTKYSWIYNNAYKYGFVNSENTFTYVVTAISTYMKTKSITGVEALIKALNGKNVSVSVTADKASKATTYQIYYLAKDAEELKVPANYEYSVIPNGDNGYFVVVDMSKKVQTETSANTDGGVG